ncbi:MAG: hypothetical protein JKX88_05480 [Marinicaulis sp.]|nr:hypothetical protein [Marinicaulis sp.]
MSDIPDNSMAELNGKLDQIIRLLALSSINTNGSVKDNAVQLNKVGLAPKEIAALLGTTPNTVSVALSTAKRSKKKSVRKKND